MNKSIITKLGMGVLIVLLVCGCQIAGKGPSDEELINATMADWKAAHVAQDLDKLMATISENYVSMRGGGKDSMREFLTRAFEEGWMDEVEVKIEDAQITIEGDKATFGPVEFISDRGTFALDYILQKEDGTWLIVGQERQEQ